MNEKGDRIGVILGSRKDGSVDFFGYGVYVGDEIPLEAIGWMAETMRELKRKNPKLKLDNGDAVYGCESWWGPEEKVKEMLEGKIVNVVSIDKVREEYKNK